MSGLINVLSTIKNGYNKIDSIQRYDMCYYNVYAQAAASYKKIKSR